MMKLIINNNLKMTNTTDIDIDNTSINISKQNKHYLTQKELFGNIEQNISKTLQKLISKQIELEERAQQINYITAKKQTYINYIQEYIKTMTKALDYFYIHSNKKDNIALQHLVLKILNTKLVELTQYDTDTIIKLRAHQKYLNQKISKTNKLLIQNDTLKDNINYQFLKKM